MTAREPSGEAIEIELDEADLESHVKASGSGVIGRYQLCFQLASGGMARVYLARTQGVAGVDKLVALKRIHEHLADQPEFVEMFLDEARIASRIDHPNVCSVFDFGEDAGVYFIAMEYLLGQTAGKVATTVARDPALRDTAHWWAIAVHIVAQACEGLHAAHELRGERGEPLHVVHRDVSPHNLFVSYDGAVKVVDFGIASASGRLTTTNAGTVKGRYAYMAPEQAKGGRVDRRADVWSLGVTLWELVSCARLFRRSNDAETIMAVVHDPISPPSQLRPHLPRGLDAVVMKALAREPAERYSSAREMGRDLSRILVAQEISVGNADVAELMLGLFPGGREQALHMVGEARVAPAGVIRRAPDDPTATDRLERRGAPLPTLQAPPRRDGRGRVVTLAIGLAGGIALTLAVTLWLGGFGSQAATEPIEEVEHASLPAGTIERPPEATRVEPVLVAPPEAEPQPEPEPEPIQEAPPPDTQLPRGPSERTPRDTEMRATTMQARPTGPPGTVNVVTPGGWADIYVNGTRRGRSPGRVSLPAGRHTITLRPFGREAPRNVSVEVPPGGTARVSVRLTR